MHGMNEWDLIWRLGLALLLSAAIGLDRELRQKSAGLRTYTLVGVGTATAKSMAFNIVAVHIIGMVGTLVFWGANPRLPIGG